MRSFDPKLQVQVVDDEILISLPVSYAVIYYKPERSPQLLARNIPLEDDLRIPMKLSEFLAQAWQLANEKAVNSSGLPDVITGTGT